MKVDVERAAPRIWRILPEEYKATAVYVAGKLASTQEAAPQGFSQGTGHGLGHVEAVLQRADALVGFSTRIRPDLNPLEAHLLVLAVLVHDIGLVYSRDGHADTDRLREVAAAAGLQVDDDTVAVALDIAAAHSGKGAIERLQRRPGVVDPDRQELADQRKIAALLRLSDEVAEDRRRTSRARTASPNIQAAAVPYHMYAEKAIVRFDEDSKGILIDVSCSKAELQTISGEGWEAKPLISHFLDRALKTELERQYCTRFLPASMVPRLTQLQVRDRRSVDPWLDVRVPSNPSELRRSVYEVEPRLVVPSMTIRGADDVARMLTIALRECYADSMRSLVFYASRARQGRGADYDILILLEDRFEGPSGELLRFILQRARRGLNAPISLDSTTVTCFAERLALGEPLALAMAKDGTCVVNSHLFQALQRLVNGIESFPTGPLCAHLLTAVREEIQGLEKPQAEFDQVQGMYRAFMGMAQGVLIRRDRQDSILSSSAYRLSQPLHVLEELKKRGLPSELVEDFEVVLTEFRDLPFVTEPQRSEPLSDHRRAALARWGSLARSVFMEVSQDDA